MIFVFILSDLMLRDSDQNSCVIFILIIVLMCTKYIGHPL